MVFKIKGLDKLQKQLKDAERAFRSLDGPLKMIQFEPDQPASIFAAITQTENEIDRVVSPYRGNPFVENVAEQLKETYKDDILERAARARSQTSLEDAPLPTDKIPLLLRQIENTVNDLKWAESSSFDRHVKKLSRLLHDPDVAAVTDSLIKGIDLDTWLKTGEATQGGMIGSATLDWPSDHNAELGTVILLIDQFANDDNAALNFAHTFYYNGNKYTANLQNMVAQVIVPFARDYIDHVKRELGVDELVKTPAKAAALARKVFVVHGHNDGAREAVCRFLEKLGFEAITLFEQANQGRTIIEKFEAYTDVSFAVVLLTADDEGNAKGKPPQPRARQNVIFELGYFVGRLTRSRIMALVQGDIEIPSDLQGIVHEPYATGGPWKQTLGRELQAAGFDIDWNLVMKS